MQHLDVSSVRRTPTISNSPAEQNPSGRSLRERNRRIAVTRELVALAGNLALHWSTLCVVLDKCNTNAGKVNPPKQDLALAKQEAQLAKTTLYDELSTWIGCIIRVSRPLTFHELATDVRDFSLQFCDTPASQQSGSDSPRVVREIASFGLQLDDCYSRCRSSRDSSVFVRMQREMTASERGWG